MDWDVHFVHRSDQTVLYIYNQSCIQCTFTSNKLLPKPITSIVNEQKRH